MTRCVLVSIDINEKTGDAVLLVGEQKNNKMDIINAIAGEDAKAMYELLITKKKGVLEK